MIRMLTLRKRAHDLFVDFLLRTAETWRRVGDIGQSNPTWRSHYDPIRAHRRAEVHDRRTRGGDAFLHDLEEAMKPRR